MSKKNSSKPRILILDIETSPLVTYTWGTFDQNIALNQIKSDWHLLSFAAKWLDDPPNKIMYADQSKVKDVQNDKELLKKLWVLLDQCDIVLGQNVKRFDVKKINARFLMHGMTPPSSYRIIDTLTIAKKNFALTSNKLEFLSKLNKKYQKLSHAKFAGFKLWSECLNGNKEAWKEMKKYNCYDVLATEEIYKRLAPWDNTINFDVYNTDDLNHTCSCGSQEFKLNGLAYTSTGQYQRYVCKKCGKESRGKTNLLSKEKKQSLRR